MWKTMPNSDDAYERTRLWAVASWTEARMINTAAKAWRAIASRGGGDVECGMEELKI